LAAFVPCEGQKGHRAGPIPLGPGQKGGACYRELPRIPLFLGTSVNKGKKRKDRARRRRSGVLVENKDSGPPFGQDESLLL